MFQEWINNLSADTAGPQVIAGAIGFVTVVLIGGIILTVRERRRRAVGGRLQDSRPGSIPQPPFKESRFLRLMEQVGNYVSHGRASTSLWEQLIRAGYMSRAAPAVYTGFKMLLFVVGIAITAVVVIPWETSMPRKMLMASLGGTFLFFVPNMVIRVQEKKRRDEIRLCLPDAVDLLDICVSSGIGLDMAWNMVADEIHHVSSVLGNAMDISNFEMHLGADRTEAMRNMAVRTGATQLASLAAILVQSERFGTSMATALQEFASWMREERQVQAEEEAERLPMKLLYPMALFIFPAIMVVALGPAMIHIMRTFRGM